MFKKKKKEQKNKDNKQLQGISSNDVLIRIYRPLGGNVNTLVSEFKAEEKRDQYNNLVTINDEKNLNEELDFAEDDIYTSMNTVLSLQDLTPEDRDKKLEENIIKQKKIVKALEKHVELNSVFNYPDEELKLRDLTILRTKLKNHSDRGAYFTIEKGGTRVFSFSSMGGFLIPHYHNSDTFVQYQDHTRKKKITVQEDVIFQKEMRERARNKRLESLSTFVVIASIIFFCILLFAIWQTWGIYQKQDETLHGNARQCAEYTSRLNQQMVDLMSTACVSEYIDAKQEEQKQAAEKNNAANQVVDNINTLIPATT